MTLQNRQNDQFLAPIATLRTYDVSPRQAERLRTRCRAVLRAQGRRNALVGGTSGPLFWRVIVPAVAGAWSLAYLAEIVRRIAAVYGS